MFPASKWCLSVSDTFGLFNWRLTIILMLLNISNKIAISSFPRGPFSLPCRVCPPSSGSALTYSAPSLSRSEGDVFVPVKHCFPGAHSELGSVFPSYFPGHNAQQGASESSAKSDRKKSYSFTFADSLSLLFYPLLSSPFPFSAAPSHAPLQDTPHTFVLLIHAALQLG